MYPKVKVRLQNSFDQENDFCFRWSEMNSPDEYQADSPKCVIRVPTAQILKQLPHPTPEPKAVDQKVKNSEGTDNLSTKARATSVPRPRAVLSSPDNDEMIGSKNNNRVIQPSPLQNQNTVQIQNQHVQSKILTTYAPTESPISTRRKPTSTVKDHTPSTTDRVCSIKGKLKAVKDQTPTKVKRSGNVASGQKAHPKTERPNLSAVRPGSGPQSMPRN